MRSVIYLRLISLLYGPDVQCRGNDSFNAEDFPGALVLFGDKLLKVEILTNS